MEAASFPPCLGKPPRGFARTPVSLTLAHTSGRRHESASAENRHHATSLKVLVTAKAPRTHEDHRWSRFSRILIIRCWAKWCRSSRTSGAPSRERSHSFVSSPDFEGFTRWPSPTHDATLPPAETYTPLPWTQPERECQSAMLRRVVDHQLPVTERTPRGRRGVLGIALVRVG
jgi:hypothetical protein